jgi:predicted permease
MGWPFRRRNRDLDDEIRTHLAMAERDRLERGESPEHARTAARREFGNVILVKQVAGDMSPWRHLDRPGQDLRMSMRRLSARPATTAMAIGMLALAIGLTTAMFTVVDAFIVRPLPFPDADRIGNVWMRGKRGGRTTVAPAVLRGWRDSPVFEAAEGVTTEQVILGTDGGPVVRAGAFVSAGVFDMLGVRPVRGRLFDATEGRAGTSDRAVISEDLWRGVFGGDSEIVGRRITVGSESVVVVGVLPQQFRFPQWNTEIWRAIDFDAQPPGPPRLPLAYLKLAAGVPDADALRLATETAHAADPSTANLWAERRPPVARYSGTEFADLSLPLLAGGVTLVFVVLCANVGSLLLTRFTSRRREFGMCSALGASRARLLWQASVESALLGITGALVGVGLAWLLIGVASGLLPAIFLTRSLNPLDLDGRALLAAALSGVTATLMAGLIPAWLGTRALGGPDRIDRTTTDPSGGRALSRAFLVTEVALACALLLGATLLVRSFVNLSAIDLGFDPRGIVELWIEPTPAVVAGEARRAATKQATAALASLPGITQVVQSVEIGTHWNDLYPDNPGSAAVPAQFNSHAVDTAWFDLHAVRFVRGRSFGASEEPDRVILSERLATSLWPTADPVGRSFYWDNRSYRIIGVVQERTSPVQDMEAEYSELYRPLGPAMTGGTISLKCDDGCPSEGVIRARVLASAPVDVHSVRWLEQVYREELAQPRAMATLGLVFGSLALAVAASGLFTVLSHAVGRRRREFGIRLALGSTPAQVRSLVMREGFRVAIAGLCLGSIAAWLLARALASLLYGVAPSDPLTWGIVLVALLMATMAGVWRPATQAMRVNPIALLREE